MVPSEYLGFFSTMAAVGATLFGLIFVAISITPESQTHADPPQLREIKAVTAYVALVNPLIISLFALVPHQQIGIVVIAMGISGIVNTLVMTLTLLQTSLPPSEKLGNSPFILVGFLLYGYETAYAIRILQSPADGAAIYSLSSLLIVIAIFGVIRSWELVGIRQFHVRSWLSSLRPSSDHEKPPTTDPVDKRTEEIKK